VLKPLLIEEGYEQVKINFQDQCAKKQVVCCRKLSAISCLKRPSLWRIQLLIAKPHFQTSKFELDYNSIKFRERQVIILCSHRPPRFEALDWVKKYNKQQREVKKNPKSSKINQLCNRFFNCRFTSNDIKNANAVVDLTLRSKPKDRRPTSFYIFASIITEITKNTITVELTTENGADKRKENPYDLEFTSFLWIIPCDSLAVKDREYEAAINLSFTHLLSSILRPYGVILYKKFGKSTLKNKSLWMKNYLGTTMKNFLSRNYDHSQLNVIRHSSSFLETKTINKRKAKRIKTIPNLLIAKQPFTLVQGPPGTGKTHTVCGILNLWHLVQYQIYYKSLENFLMHPLVTDFLLQELKNSIDNFKSKKFEINKSVKNAKHIYKLIITNNSLFQHLVIVQHKPKILVCAPSNAAVDELMSRVLVQGFIDLSGHNYFPSCLRVGNIEAKLNSKIHALFIETHIDEWMSMTYESHRKRKLIAKTQLVSAYYNLLQYFRLVSKGIATCSLGKEMVHCFNKLEIGYLELERLKMIKFTKLRGKKVRENPKLSHSITTPVLRYIYRKLESSFINRSQLIFTTLSSCDRHLLTIGDFRFEAILIDEACQACEVSIFQPLKYNPKHLVMVGDPKQLSATVLSRSGKLSFLERSLFERIIQNRNSAKMLNIQYRMHPFIRMYPSRTFYSNQVIDSVNILSFDQQLFYSHRFLKPYVFFDVNGGREHKYACGSLKNSEEALLTLSLYIELRECLSDLTMNRIDTTLTVGIITPYSKQKAHINAIFRKILDTKEITKLQIDTIDCFQGRQVDVVILSCVRANRNPSSVGFLADFRRLNVAITRAKKAIWLLGNVRTLCINEGWRQLLSYTSRRGLLVGAVSAESLFPGQSVSQLEARSWFETFFS
jgi:superfamily I DNA and/or RNA helicase